MTDEIVRLQYEDYPYPPRDPADEQKRLITGSPSQICEINHYLFSGRRDFSKPFHALVAGGGTGDAAIMLSQQLADAGNAGEVTYLDVSKASGRIARARAEARGLTNINFVQGSITELSGLVSGPFDYIDCCGVLHHLEDPLVGLRALENVLADDGGMGLMVYAPYGRTGVYQMQALLRMIGDDYPPAERIKQAKSLLGQLPPTNWLRRNELVADHLNVGDSGLFDLLLHSQDRAYSVPEVAELVSQADLRLVSFIEPILYDPEAFIGDPHLLNKINQLSSIDRCAFTELLTGSLKTHVFYVAKKNNPLRTIARADDDELCPMLVGLDVATASNSIAASGQITVELGGLKRSIPLSPDAIELLTLMDGRRSIKEIRRSRSAVASPSNSEAFDHLFNEIFGLLNGLNMAFLRI